MGSYLVFVVAGFILVLFCVEAQPPPYVQSSPLAPSAAAAAAAATTTESSVQKLQLKVTDTFFKSRSLKLK